MPLELLLEQLQRLQFLDQHAVRLPIARSPATTVANSWWIRWPRELANEVRRAIRRRRRAPGRGGGGSTWRCRGVVAAAVLAVQPVQIGYLHGLAMARARDFYAGESKTDPKDA